MNRTIHGTILAVVVLCFCSASLMAQKTIYLASENGFDPFGFTTKLTAALQKSSIGARFKTATTADLERINASKPGDLAVQIVSNELQCSGQKIVILSLIFVELGRDKVNSVQKIYIGASTGYISEHTVDADVDQYRDHIVGSLGGR